MLQDGLLTVSLPQNSSVVPQKPYLLQQTLRGHLVELKYCEGQLPGLHSALKSQLLMHFALLQ